MSQTFCLGERERPTVACGRRSNGGEGEFTAVRRERHMSFWPRLAHQSYSSNLRLSGSSLLSKLADQDPSNSTFSVKFDVALKLRLNYLAHNAMKSCLKDVGTCHTLDE